MKTIIMLAALLLAAVRPAMTEESGNAAWEKLSPQQRKEALAAYERWKAEPKERQEKLTENYRRFQGMSPEKRAEIARRWERFNSLPTEQKQALLSKYNKWKELSPQRQDELRRKYSRDRDTPGQEGRGGGREGRSERGGGRGR